MDCLLEALKTGTAFSRDGQRKRQARLAGAERRAQLARTRSRAKMSTRSVSDVMDVVTEDEARRVSCVDIRNNVEDDSPAFQGRTASVSSQLDQWRKMSEDSDLMVRKLRDL